MTQDPFTLLGLPAEFDLSPEELERRYLSAAATHHPDRHPDPLDQADAAERTAEINTAYQMLREPESRANALLALRGGPSAADDRSLPPTLLMEMMEVGEAVEKAAEKKDGPTLSRLRGEVEQKRAAHLEAVGALFQAEPMDPAAIRLELNGLRYVERTLSQWPV
ncbi:MAG: Fe-S protein assembly co-chaperone HscB [Planctomycetota bacterium]